MPYREKTRYPGVYERASQERKYKGAPDTCYDISYKLNGKKVWEKIGWASEGYSAKLAADIRAERMRSMRHGEDLPVQKKRIPTFEKAAEKYLKWAATSKTKGGRDDRFMIKNHLSEPFNDKRLDQISALDLERLKSEMLKAEYAPSTVKHALVIMRQIYNRCKVWGLYQGDNPVKGIKMPALNNQRERFLSTDEAEKLLDALRKHSNQLHGMALLSLHTGMRAGEVFALRVGDVDFRNGLIHVADPKNKRPRKAYMTASVKEMLQSRINKDMEKQVLVFPSDTGEKIVFLSKTFGRTVDEIELNKGVKDTRQKVTFHTLRHTFASWLALQGETIQTISELLGHSSLQMTMRYAHLSPDHRKKAIQKFEQGLAEKQEQGVQG